MAGRRLGNMPPLSFQARLGVAARLGPERLDHPMDNVLMIPLFLLIFVITIYLAIKLDMHNKGSKQKVIRDPAKKERGDAVNELLKNPNLNEDEIKKM
jgi:uncharacterized protein YneF (UPF0154 family)